MVVIPFFPSSRPPPKKKKMFKYLFNKAADDDGKWRRSRGISIKMGCVSYAHDVKSPLLSFFIQSPFFFLILRLQVCCSHLIQRLVNPLSLPPSHFGYVILMMNDDGPEKKRGMLRMRRWENTRPPPPSIPLAHLFPFPRPSKSPRHPSLFPIYMLMKDAVRGDVMIAPSS